MGLFFKRKKEIPPSFQPAQQSQARDFDKLAPEIPPPPSELGKGPFKIQDMNSGSAQQEQAFEQPFSYQELRPGEAPVGPGIKPGAGQEGAVAEEKKGFELPDFDDAEIFRAEQVLVRKEPEKKPAPEPEPEQPEPKAEYPEPQKPLPKMKEDFLYVMNYLNAREAANDTTILTSDTAQMVSQHSITSKLKDDKYNAFVKELNALQEQLMLIDTKLFEGM
jgi:hypothetical protein